MKTRVSCSLVSLLFFVFLLVACNTPISSPPAVIEIDKDVSLPLVIDDVWYRTDKIRLLSFEESGKLTVGITSVQFTYDKGKIEIPTENIQKVVWGKLSPDLTTDWVIVYYTGSAKNVVAAFKGAPYADRRKDSNIYSAILQTMNAK